MPHEVMVYENEGFIGVRIFGSASREEHIAVQKNTIDICRQSGLRKLLVDLSDLSTEGIVSTIGCFEFGKTLAENGRSLGLRIAHV